MSRINTSRVIAKMVYTVACLEWAFINLIRYTMRPLRTPSLFQFNVKHAIAVAMNNTMPEPTVISFFNLRFKAFAKGYRFWSSCFHGAKIPLSTPYSYTEYIGNILMQELQVSP